MKVLVIAPFPTDPLDAGNRARVANFIAALKADEHEVHFAHIQTTDFDGDAMVRRIGTDKVHLLPYIAHPPGLPRQMRWLRQVGQRLSFDRSFVWPIDDWYAKVCTPLLAALHSQHRFDVVVVNYVFLTKAFDAFPAPCLRVLDTHDSMGLRHRRYLRIGMKPHWFSTTMADEERGFRRADVLIAIQPHEAAEFRRRLGPAERPAVVTVGHLIDLPSLSPLPDRPSAVFVGSHNPLNVQGLQHYLAHVHPLVRRSVPDFKLVVAGASAAELPDAPGLVKLGYVSNLSQAFQAGRVFINPVLMGTGVAIKLLDAMAYGMPCVSTRSGARGLEAVTSIDVADDHDNAGFAARMVALLTDPELCESRRASVRAAAEQWNVTQLAALSALTRDAARLRLA